MRRLTLLLVTSTLAACGLAGPGAEAPTAEPASTPGTTAAEAPEAARPALERPLPYPVVPPGGYQRSIALDTRTPEGEPGPDYWQQWTEYDIDARVDVDARTLVGSETIRYHNNSPNRLPMLLLNLHQNYHAEGVERVRPTEVTGGVDIERVAYNGRELGPTSNQQTPGWIVNGTLMLVVLPSPVAPGEAVELAVDWSFPIPQAGASGRMGYSNDELLYLAYWFPQMAVYDDVIGWHMEAFRGNAEFYSDFGSYRVTIDAPAEYLVMSTGTLQNRDAVLAPDVVERLDRAEASDTVVHVVTHAGAAEATADGEGGRLTWEFAADSVRDVAFGVMKNYAWDAARTPVGDRDGDGETEYSRVDAFWRDYAANYVDAWRYAQHSIDFLSRFTGLPYPWAHMSVVEGGGIIGGGMEFPMMTLIGDYNQRGADALYYVTAHELAHMWVPMTLNSNERRYAWLDEGTTTFNENNARVEFFGGAEAAEQPFQSEQNGYLSVARAGMEGPIMRWSDHHRPGPAYGTASYAKPAAVLHALRGVLGDAVFMEAYREFYRRWAFKHPYPWDLFRTFESVTGRNLEWFWRAWYYESTQDGRWFLDQAIADVQRLESGETRITVDDLGWIPMPVHLQITREDGDVSTEVISVSRWLDGADQTAITLPAGPAVTRVVIDADRYFPDFDRSNNGWER
ncbi:MAG: M1 family metallopeptidase [Longimicrobiales bacterium]